MEGRSPIGRRVRDRLTETTYALGWAVVRHVPERVVLAAAARAADRAWRRRSRGVRQLEANLHRVLGPDAAEAQVRETARAGLRSYLRYWTEAFRLPVWSEERVVGTFHLHNEQALWERLDAGRGVVVALPHSANWDHAGAWAGLVGAPVTTVAERLRPESLFRRFIAYRESLGLEVLPLAGGRNVFGVLAQRLRAGRVVCLLADRDLTRGGTTVDFFGEPAKMPAGPALLALRTGAALLPLSLWYEDDGTHAYFHPEVVPAEGDDRQSGVTAMTQSLARAFEAGIAEHPEDWHMLQRLWLADLRATDTAEATRG